LALLLIVLFGGFIMSAKNRWGRREFKRGYVIQGNNLVFQESRGNVRFVAKIPLRFPTSECFRPEPAELWDEARNVFVEVHFFHDATPIFCKVL